VYNLYSITANKAAIVAPFRVMNRYVGNAPAALTTKTGRRHNRQLFFFFHRHGHRTDRR
jgi:hypothetical protein